DDGDDEKSEEDSIEYPTSGGYDDADDDGDDLSEDDAEDEDEEESSESDESIPEADIPLRKRARFTTPTDRYEVGESSVAAAARHIRPALTIADRRRADDRLIGRLRRERRYFRTLSTTYAQEAQVRRQESENFYTQILDAQTDRKDIRLEIDVVRGQMTAYKIELQERQSIEDLAVTQMMHIHTLEARARTDTVEDADSSC
nr:hypothetical protein [Tanacetum cinerariifolium]